MNVRARISSKGQVVVPKEMRDRLGLHAGSEIEFVEGPEGVMMKRVRPMSAFPPITAAEFMARRVKWTGKPVPVEDMNRAIEDEARRMWNAENS